MYNVVAFTSITKLAITIRAVFAYGLAINAVILITRITPMYFATGAPSARSFSASYAAPSITVILAVNAQSVRTDVTLTYIFFIPKFLALQATISKKI